ncbi:VOC family protein [Elioraea rosea]|uniref:VOC family protein n=1 Tax=Elioraea rosea TaxID=2492390 RepID=UPI00118360EA|nr:VOC family protein [Elioraea rosea]
MNVYINLPVADLARTRSFFAALGFAFDDRFSDETALAMRIGDGAMAMLLTHAKFAAFTPRRIADARATTEVLTAVQLDSRAAVDRMIEAACAAGATEVREAEDHGFMYGRAFSDPDGHIWEPFWMDAAQIPARAA